MRKFLLILIIFLTILSCGEEKTPENTLNCSSTEHKENGVCVSYPAVKAFPSAFDGGAIGEGNNDLIFRYIRSRPRLARGGIEPSVAFETVFNEGKNAGDDSYTWAFKFSGGNRVIVDHCSTSFAYDKAMGGGLNGMAGGSSVWEDEEMKNFTFSHNLISDSDTGYYIAVNDNRPQLPLPATQNRITNISCLNNLTTVVNRTPNMAFGGYGEIVNNIIHDTPFKYSSVCWNLKLNQIGNYYSGEDPWTGTSSGFVRNRIIINGTTTELGSKPEIYTNKNYLKRRDNDISDIVILDGNPDNNDRILWSNYIDGFGGSGVAPLFGGQPQFFTDTRHENTIVHKYIETTAQEAFQKNVIKGDVGAYKYLDDNGEVQIYRDTFDTSQLNYVKNNDVSYEAEKASNWVLPNIPKNTRPDSYDTDHDGMADAWEIREFGNLDQSYRGDYNGDGYDNIENFLNQVDTNK